jgi:hypothetical protein
MTTPLVAEVLGAMITPAVLISAGGTLVLSTSNRLSRVVDRVRVIARDAERFDQGQEPGGDLKRQLIEAQVRDLFRRALLLRSAVATLYTSIGFLVATSIGVGLVTFFRLELSWVPILTGMLGTIALLWGAVLLVREARLAIASTLEEMRYIDTILAKDKSGASG